MAETDYDTPSQKLWEAERIIAENSHSYKIVWYGTDPDTGTKWEPTWEKKSYANSALADSWKAEQAKIKAAKKATKLAKAAELARRKALRSPSLSEPEDPATQANPIPDESYRQAAPAAPRPRKSHSRQKKALSAALVDTSDEEILPPRSKVRKVNAQKLPPRRTSSSPAKSTTPKVTKKRTVAFVEVEVEDERPRKKSNKQLARRETSVSSTTSESIQPLGHHSSTSKGKGKAKATTDSSPAKNLGGRKKKAIPRIPTSSTESTQIVPDSQSASSQAGPSVASSEAGPSNPQKDVEMEETQPDCDELQDGQRREEADDLGGMSPPQYDAPGFSQEEEAASQNLDNAFRSSGLDPMLGAATQEVASQFADADTQQPQRQKSLSPPPAPPVEQIPSSVSPPPAPLPPPAAAPLATHVVAPRNALRPVPVPRREAFNLPNHESSQTIEQDPIVDSSPEKVHRPTGGFRPTAAVEIKKRPLAMSRLEFVAPPPPKDSTPPPPRDATPPPPRDPTPPLVDSLDDLLVDEDDAAILAVVDDAVAQLGAVAEAAVGVMNQKAMEKMIVEEEEGNVFNQFLDQSYHQAEGHIVFDEAPGMVVEPAVVVMEGMEEEEGDSDDEGDSQQSLDEMEIGLKIVFEKLKIQDTLITALRAELSTLKSADPSPALAALSSELTLLRPLKEETLTLTDSLKIANTTIESLRASIADAQADVSYMRDQYQNASTAAAARAQECFVAETESKRLTSLLDIGMKQYDLIYVAQIDKLKKELQRTKGELRLAEEMNERTRGIRKMASLWEEHLAAERLEEEEREERERRMIEERQAAMLLGPGPLNMAAFGRRNGFDSSDEEDSDEESDQDMELGAVAQEMREELEGGGVEETQDSDDPDVFVCLWRPGCGEALSSRNCLEDHIIAHHILRTTDNETLPPVPNSTTLASQLSQ